MPANAPVSISRADDDHGNTLAAYKAMGSPLDPTDAQVEEMNKETALGAPEHLTLTDNRLNLKLGANALLLIKVGGNQ